MTSIRLLATLAALLCASLARAENVNWSAPDITGKNVTIPASDKPSILAFIRPDQAQSNRALDQIKSIGAADTQIVIIVSGENAIDQANSLKTSGKFSYPIVADTDFKASGQLGVHVWPTTLVIASSGVQAGHLAGLNDSFATDLRSYLELAAGKIDQATLQKHLATTNVVAEAPAQMAGSYLQVARRLIETGEIDQAKSQIEAGLKLQPSDVGLKTAMARVLILQGHAKEAIEQLDALPAGAVPPGQLAVLRGRALIGLEKWDDAKKALEPSIGLNPDPAEAHYLLGLIYQHNNDLTHASESFRKAYESREKSGRSSN